MDNRRKNSILINIVENRLSYTKIKLTFNIITSGYKIYVEILIFIYKRQYSLVELRWNNQIINNSESNFATSLIDKR